MHKELGSGLLEAVYQQCLEFELKNRGYYVESEVALPIHYKQLKFDAT